MTKRIKRLIWGILILSTIGTQAQENLIPPGVVVDYINPRSEKFIGSPSLCILPNGDYIASHDEFGPKSTEFQSAQTLVFKSTDRGNTWEKISQINGQFWSNLFLHKGDLYIMGTNKHHGNVVLRKSTDGGVTWTNPYYAENGLILEGEYHTAPVPVIEHNGRLWRAIEYATAASDRWGERYSAVMLSVPIDSNILDAKNWTRSNHMPFNADYLNGNFKAWLEGNAVVNRNGDVLDILRVHLPKGNGEKAAIVRVSRDGKTLTFDEKDFIEMPGASKKFTIRYDKVTDRYWSLVNNVPDEYMEKAGPDRIRNFVSLASSSNLREWTLHETVLSHPDNLKHGFQYIDWVFDGNDIVFVSRTAYNDAEGGAKGYHDANYLTFNRIQNFKDSKRSLIISSIK